MPTFLQYLKSYWELFRLEHGLMYGLAVLVGVFVSDTNYSNLQKIIFAYLTAVLLQASTFALNDSFDYEVDIKNKRFDRPLVRGEISKRGALISSVLLFPLGLFTALLISLESFIFATAVSVAGVLYDVKLKEFGIAGNIYVAFSMAAPFIFGSIVALDSIYSMATILAMIAFFSGLGREIMKGIEDVEGDKLRNVRSVAIVKGENFASRLSAYFYLLAVLLSFLPVLNPEYLDFKYLIPVAIADLMFFDASAKLLRGAKKESIPKFRKKTLFAMLFGLVGFLLGTF
ncbi:MAG: UbiA family prenyltransferase [Archaeoglobales archaeon]|nr:UbiA family prenyltransferase [Archaeoglobales archaeon]